MKRATARVLSRAMSCALLAAALVPLAGCWDHVEISDLSYIAGLALDYLPQTGEIVATIEVVNVSSGKGEGTEPALLTGRGVNIDDALRNLIGQLGGRLYFNHCDLLAIGEDFARSGIADIVDSVVRNTDFQQTMAVAVVRGGTGEDLLGVKAEANPIVSMEAGKVLKNNLSHYLGAYQKGVIELHNLLSGDADAGVAMSCLELTGEEKQGFLATGTAVLHGDRLVGFLDEDETTYFRVAIGDVKRGSLRVREGGGVPAYASARIKKLKTSYACSLDGQDPRLELKVSASLDVSEPQPAAGRMSDEGGVSKLEEDFAKSLRRGVEKVVAKVQREFGCDIFSFSKAFEIQKRGQWPAWKDNWNELFSRMDVGVTTEVDIVGTGLSRKNKLAENPIT